MLRYMKLPTGKGLRLCMDKEHHYRAKTAILRKLEKCGSSGARKISGNAPSLWHDSVHLALPLAGSRLRCGNVSSTSDTFHQNSQAVKKPHYQLTLVWIKEHGTIPMLRHKNMMREWQWERKIRENLSNVAMSIHWPLWSVICFLFNYQNACSTLRIACIKNTKDGTKFACIKNTKDGIKNTKDGTKFACMKNTK